MKAAGRIGLRGAIAIRLMHADRMRERDKRQDNAKVMNRTDAPENQLKRNLVGTDLAPFTDNGQNGANGTDVD